MNYATSIEPAVRASAERQVTLHRLTGGIWMFLGAIFSVAIFVPGKEDEDVIRVVCAVLGVLALLFGVFYIKFMSARTRVLVELLLHRRQELRQPVLLVRKARGHIVGYGVYVRDLQGRKYKMQVLAEQDARAMLANIPP